MQKTHPVGMKRPNSWGLYDIIGNVWEWCNDWFSEDYYSKSPELNPHGPDSGTGRRVYRGGSWGVDNDYNLRSAYRSGNNPNIAWDGGGFRCVLSNQTKG